MVNRYLTAQVCTNGHTITRAFVREGEDKYCSLCGAETITKCEECNAPLRGRLYGVPPSGVLPRPKPFCYNCGKQYPWTKSIIENAKELANEIDEFNDDDKTVIIENIQDIIVETPRTELASRRIIKVLRKGGQKVYDGFYRLLVDVLAKTAKDQFIGG